MDWIRRAIKRARESSVGVLERFMTHEEDDLARLREGKLVYSSHADAFVPEGQLGATPGDATEEEVESLRRKHGLATAPWEWSYYSVRGIEDDVARRGIGEIHRIQELRRREAREPPRRRGQWE